MSEPLRHRLPWVLLGGLLGALLLAAVSFDRASWPRLVGDEATYLMQAESLAFDFDLVYELGDYQRFVDHWGFAPEGLILQSGDAGQTITYGKPAIYPLAIAPFVRFAPRRGAAIGNAFYLALAGWLVAMTLRRFADATAPLWVAAFLFGSVTFGHVFWAHADLFLLCLVATALALIYRQPSADRDPDETLSLALAGVLLALVGLSRPLYLSLLLPACLATGRQRRAQRSLALVAGFGLVLVASILVNLGVRGSWTPYGGQRMGFYTETGFPAVDFATESWETKLGERPGTGSWVDRDKFLFHFSPRLAAYDLYYYLTGRSIGLVPYFLPGLFAFVAWRSARGRWALPLAVALTAAGFFYLRAFNFYGGGGALANRYFLPMYPALWFVVARRRHWLWPVGATLLAAPFLWPLWTAPRAFPMHPEGGLRYVSSAAVSLLPYETSLSHLKPAGREDVSTGGLWVKFLSRGLGFDPDAKRFRQPEPRAVELLVGADRPLTTIELFLDRPAAAVPEVGGAIRDLTPAAAGSSRYTLRLGQPSAQHRMWWTFEPVYLYRLELDQLASGRGSVSFALFAPTEPSAELSPAQPVVETSRRQVLLDRPQALERRTVEGLEGQPRGAVGVVQFPRPAARRPLQLEIGKGPGELLEVDPVAALVRPGIGRHGERTARYRFRHDLGQVPNAEVLVAAANVEGLVVDPVARRLEQGEEHPADVLDVYHRSPGTAVGE